MRLPDKIISYDESILHFLPMMLNALSSCDMTPIGLFDLLSRSISITDFVEALDCLYILGKIELDEQSGEIHYVA